jgi:hypothetical protein
MSVKLKFRLENLSSYLEPVQAAVLNNSTQAYVSPFIAHEKRTLNFTTAEETANLKRGVDGHLSIELTHPDEWNPFELGQEYFVEITPVREI